MRLKVLDAQETKEEISRPELGHRTEPWLRTVTKRPGSRSVRAAESTHLQFARFSLCNLTPGWRRKVGGRT